MSGSTVAEFYCGRSVLITGATGFMGKVLVEKLLRTCPGVSSIYLLMRPKYNQEVTVRLQRLLKTQCFDDIREASPDCLSKLIAVEGDITLPSLGLSAANTKMLTDNISIVFHSAATVKFDEALRLSLQMNVQGTQRVIELCHKMHKLVSLVHVSTAYCNCDKDEILEKVYPVSVDPEKLMQLTEWMDDADIEYLTPRLLGKRPNTYTFTKALAEKLVSEEAADLPYCIVRPSIVTASWREPTPGWVDNLNGATGVIVGAGKGVIRTIRCDESLRADIMPVDIAINLLISVAWYTATERKENGLIYNCVSSSQKPFYWRDFRDFGMEYLKVGVLNDIIFYPDLSFTKNPYIHAISLFFKHHIPCYVLDFITKLSGRKPIMGKIYYKMHKAINCLEYFTTHQWTWADGNVRHLWNSLSEKDQNSFNFDASQIDWKCYMVDYIHGVKKFVLKEKIESIPAAKKQANKLWWFHQCLRILFVVITWRLIMLRSLSARQAWAGLLRMMLRMITYLPLINRI